MMSPVGKTNQLDDFYISRLNSTNFFLKTVVNCSAPGKGIRGICTAASESYNVLFISYINHMKYPMKWCNNDQKTNQKMYKQYIIYKYISRPVQIKTEIIKSLLVTVLWFLLAWYPYFKILHIEIRVSSFLIALFLCT